MQQNLQIWTTSYFKKFPYGGEGLGLKIPGLAPKTREMVIKTEMVEVTVCS